MPEPRVEVLCIAIGLTALVANSIAAYIVDREPAIFTGAPFVVLLAGWVACWVMWVLATRAHRKQLREEADEYRMAVMVEQWRSAPGSGSWPRPPVD